MSAAAPLELSLESTAPAAPADTGPLAAARWLLRELAARGIVIVRLADRLRVTAQPGAFTPDYRELVTAMKAEIIAALTSHRCVGCGSGWFPEPGTTCYWCRQLGPDWRTRGTSTPTGA